MGKVIIYIKLVDGQLMYRDDEHDHGHSIKTSVDPGDTVIWKLDKSELTDIKILKGPKHFFSEGPKQKDFNEWKAEVSKKAEGTITYEPDYLACIEGEKKATLAATKKSRNIKDDDAPSINIKP